MKKKSTSKSAFFNLRVLIGLFMVLAAFFVALLGSGFTLSAAAQGIIKAMPKGKIITFSKDPLVPVGFDCSKIHELGIDKQENFRAGAIMMACGEMPGVAPSTTSTFGPIGRFFQRLLTPLAYGGADVNLINHPETFPNITQSETFTTVNPENPLQIVVAYNDSRGRNASPINISGASVSTDGGTTFDRLTGANGQSPFSNTEGDPVILYNQPSHTWFTVWLYVAGMDENSGNGCLSGCGSNRRNVMYRSTDGGVTFTNTYTGSAFVGPCRSASGFFCTMYNSPAYWRHMGWGEPAAYNHVVSLVYAQKDGSDPGNVYYIRSTDSGVTFSAPFQLNTNTDVTKAQWQPNLSVSDLGILLATWYDETPRTSASCQPSSPTNLCYQMHSRRSNDNGVTWLADDTLSDVVSPLPLQPDPGIQPLYVGDYDYGSAVLNKNATSWVDGRNPINGASQQDAYTDRELGATPTASPTPTSSATASPTPTNTPTPTPCVVQYTITQIGGSIVPGTTDIGNHGDDTVVTIPLPFSYTLYDQAFTSINLSSNGNAQFMTTDTTFTNPRLPWTAHNYP